MGRNAPGVPLYAEIEFEMAHHPPLHHRAAFGPTMRQLARVVDR